MDNEPYRDLSHHEARDLIPHLWPESTATQRTELRLPSGHIADVAMRTYENTIVIVEVKTFLRDSLVNMAWGKYGPWCNQLYVAVPHLRVNGLSDIPFLLEWTQQSERVGILGVYRDSLAVIRQAAWRPMQPQDRRSLDLILKTP